MQIAYKLKLFKPSKRKLELIEKNMVNNALNKKEISKIFLKDLSVKLTTKDFKDSGVPATVINQNIRDVKGNVKALKNTGYNKDSLDFKDIQPLTFNNQAVRINDKAFSIPLYNGDKVERIWLVFDSNEKLDQFQKAFNHKDTKLGTTTVNKKHGEYYASIVLNVKNEGVVQDSLIAMGVDVGLRQIAVLSVKKYEKGSDEGKELCRKLFSGKQVAHQRRIYSSQRRKLGKKKQIKKISKIKDKESNFIKDTNHKISKEIIDFAVKNKVSIIFMENLGNIRNTAYSHKRADINLNSWAFFELQSFITYKAKQKGIEVSFIDPKYTSQKCNKCGEIRKSNRKQDDYQCQCGYRTHADLNAARNIVDKGFFK